MTDCDRIRSWRCDDDGNCVADCRARSGGVCEATFDVPCTGRPCPVRRLQLALGLAVSTTPTTPGPAVPGAVEDRVVDALRAGPRDARQLRAAVTGKAREIDEARDELVAAGAVRRSVSGARTIFALVDSPAVEAAPEAEPEAEPVGTRNDDAGVTLCDNGGQDDGETALSAIDAEFERAREVEGTAARPRKIRVDREDPT